jgi:hypothetical protein
MRTSLVRLVCAFAVLAIVEAAGCGSSSSPSDGGQAGSTGSAGTTGAAGHGSAGSTGTAGQGMSTGSAGHGAAGATGAAGHGAGGTGGAPSCDDLASQYQAALVPASACTVGAANQCGVKVSSSLNPCFIDCMTYVQDGAHLDDLKSQWMTAGCGAKPQVCPAIACLQPTAASCAHGDGGAGMCVSAAPFTTN